MANEDPVQKYRRAYGRYPHVGDPPKAKTVSRDIKRLVESYAGTKTALNRRQARVSAAAKRGGTPPIDTRTPRGAQKVNQNITVGHFGVRSFLKGFGLNEPELTKESSTGAQSARSNFGKKGQGSKTIMKWRSDLAKMKLGTYPDRPTELEPVKARTKDRRKITTSSGKTSVYGDTKRLIGPAPRYGATKFGRGLYSFASDPAIAGAASRFIGKKIYGEGYKEGSFGLGGDLIKSVVSKSTLRGIGF